MYILVEKELARKKRNKIIHHLEKTYGLVNMFAIFLNECTSFFVVDYPTKKKSVWTVERSAVRGAKVKKKK